MLRTLPSFLLGILVFVSGCTQQPTPLSLDEIPAKMSAVFAPAKIHVKKTSDAIVEMVKAKQWAGASMQLQALLGNTTLTKEQRDVASQSLMAINLALSEQASSISSAPPAPAEEAQASTKAPAPAASPQEAATAAAIMEHHLRTK